MGGGVSVSIAAMAQELNGAEKKRFKEYYDELVKKGFSEQRIRNQLIEKLKLERSSTSKIRPKTSNRREIINRKCSVEDKLPTIYHDDSASKDDSDVAVLTMPFLSFPVTETTTICSDSISTYLNDSFDCSLCQSNFKNKCQLDRHIKYSEKHAKALETVSKANRLSTLMHTCIAAMETKRNNIDAVNEARKRWIWAYKKVMLQLAIDRTTQKLVLSLQKEDPSASSTLLFEGSKLFWKFQYTVQLHIYHHEQVLKIQDGGKSSIIEIIGYCVSKHRELGRLYLAYSVLEAILSTEIKRQTEDSRTGAHNRAMAAYRVSKNDDHFRDEIILNFVLKHLDVEARIGHIAGVDLVFKSISKDDDIRQLRNVPDQDPFSIHKAIVPFSIISRELRPMYIVRRRHSTEAERTETFAELKQHQSQLTHLTGRAEAVANILSASTQTLSSISKAHAQRNRSDFTAARNRWFGAVHRTIVQLAVDANRSRYHLGAAKLNAPLLDSGAANCISNSTKTSKAMKPVQLSVGLEVSSPSSKVLVSPGPYSLLKKANASPANASGQFRKVALVLSGKSTSGQPNEV